MRRERRRLEALLEATDRGDWEPSEMVALIEAHLDWILDQILVHERPFYREALRRRARAPRKPTLDVLASGQAWREEFGGCWEGSGLPADYPMATLA